MEFKVKAFGEERVYNRKVSLLEILGDRDPEKKIVVAKVNNRVRELTYEVYYDSEVEFSGITDIPAMKVYEASLRYVVAMAFARCYPNLRVRFAYNVSRSIGIHLITPGVTATTAMLINIKHEIDNIIQADLPMKRMKVSVEEARKMFEDRGWSDKIELLKYRPEKDAHLYECDGFYDYMYSHMVPSTGYIHKYKLRLLAPGFVLQYPRTEAQGEMPDFQEEPTYSRALKESHDWSKIIGSATVPGINHEIESRGDIDYINLHGTGTLANDETEAKSMFKIFKDKTPCSSTKSITGHCLGAAAAIETALCCKCIENGIILKHNYDGAFDENLPRINLAAENSHNNIKYVMNNAFGFGGTNAVMILGKSNLSVEKILPHEFPMILIDEVTEVNFEKNYLVSKVKIKDTMPFFDKTINGISSVAGIEFMAQTIGCYSYLKRSENSPQIGFLLGTRIYNNAVEKFENRKEYFIKVEEIYNDHKICAFGCQIFDDTQDEIACATINAYQPDNLEEILKSDE